jgi:hypothetical protein
VHVDTLVTVLVLIALTARWLMTVLPVIAGRIGYLLGSAMRARAVRVVQGPIGR